MEESDDLIKRTKAGFRELVMNTKDVSKRKVISGKDKTEEADDFDLDKYSSHEDILDRISNKAQKIISVIDQYAHAAISLLIAGYTIYYTNLFYNLFYNPYVPLVWLIFTLIFFICIVGLISYISFYLPFKGKTEEEIDKALEKLTPYLTIVALCLLFSFVNAVWLLYWWFSILIAIIIPWALILSSNFAPNGKYGNIVCIALIIIAFASGKFIKHKGHTYVS